MKKLLLSLACALTLTAGAQQAAECPIVPLPLHYAATNGGAYRLTAKTVIAADAALMPQARYLAETLAEPTGWDLTVREGRRGDIVIAMDTVGVPQAEGYRLSVSRRGVRIAAHDAAGAFYAVQSMLQTMPADIHGSRRIAGATWTIPAVEVEHAPCHPWLGFMLDAARYYYDQTFVKKCIDMMAMYKMNKLQFHFIDDCGWRLESKKYPRLTEVGAWAGKGERRIGGYYTQDEMRELVRFAADYHVDIIPEIEMPGHEVAAIHCFPQLTCGAKEVPIRTTCGVSNELLCPGEPFVYEFLGNVLGELAAVFPSPYVHLGGDEAGNPALGCWTDCPKCRALKRRLGIEGDRREDNWRLQEHLFNSIIDTLRTKHGKTPMFWYETDFKRIPEGCIVFAWRHGLTAAAIRAAVANDARIMLCPGEHCYLDYPMAGGDMPEVNWGMPITSLAQTYRLDPAWGFGPTSDCPTFEERHLAGVAGTLWSECINSPERLYYQAFPRALALAEAGWTPQARRDAADFDRRLQAALRDMARRGICRSAVTWQQAAH